MAQTQALPEATAARPVSAHSCRSEMGGCDGYIIPQLDNSASTPTPEPPRATTIHGFALSRGTKDRLHLGLVA